MKKPITTEKKGDFFMLFNSMIFLWIFLPISIITYFIVDKKYQNLILLILSLIFYAWGKPSYIVILLFSIIFNYYIRNLNW